MFKTTKEIINTLEEAVLIFRNSHSDINREEARLIVCASKHALQALALDFAEKISN